MLFLRVVILALFLFVVPCVTPIFQTFINTVPLASPDTVSKPLVSQLLVFVTSVYRRNTSGCAIGFPAIIRLKIHLQEKTTMFLYPLPQSAYASNFPSPVQVT
jgi:hypothetical protein